MQRTGVEPPVRREDFIIDPTSAPYWDGGESWQFVNTSMQGRTGPNMTFGATNEPQPTDIHSAPLHTIEQAEPKEWSNISATGTLVDIVAEEHKKACKYWDIHGLPNVPFTLRR